MAAISSTDIYNAPEAHLTESTPEVKSGLLSMNGRLGVLKYMAHSTLLMIAMMALFTIVALASGVSMSGEAAPQLSPLIILGFGVCTLPAAWVGFTMFAKRLHDLNLNAWYMLLVFIPILGGLFSIFAICAPGMKEGNQFGALNPTANWEVALGIIGLVLFVGTMLASIAAITLPFVMSVF